MGTECEGCRVSYSQSFFEVAAQLVPVLFLAMVVEERLQPDDEETSGERITRSWLLATLVVGEVLALSVIAGGLSPTSAVGSIVAMTMLMAAFLIAVPVIGREMSDDRTRAERLGHATAGLAVLVAVLGTVAAVALG